MKEHIHLRLGIHMTFPLSYALFSSEALNPMAASLHANPCYTLTAYIYEISPQTGVTINHAILGPGSVSCFG